MEGGGGIANSHRVLRSNHGGKLALEGFHLRSTRQKIRTQRSHDDGNVVLINRLASVGKHHAKYGKKLRPTYRKFNPKIGAKSSSFDGNLWLQPWWQCRVQYRVSTIREPFFSQGEKRSFNEVGKDDSANNRSRKECSAAQRHAKNLAGQMVRREH